ncbi:MAG: hypothetical protein ABIL76_03985 [candidate division WOR-3 bacterium]
MNETKRKGITLFIDQDVWYDFQIKCDKMGYIPSRIIEYFMRKFIKNPRILIEEDDDEEFENLDED